MQTQNSVAGSDNSAETLGLELSLKLYSQPKPDCEPVKILVVGSREGGNTIIHSKIWFFEAKEDVILTHRYGLRDDQWEKMQDHLPDRPGSVEAFKKTLRQRRIKIKNICLA